jgi:hypothetical protein
LNRNLFRAACGVGNLSSTVHLTDGAALSLTDTPTPHLLDGWLELDDFARAEVKKHPRTVKRWTQSPNGLPYSTLGKTAIIHVPTARDWLFARMHRPNRRRSI